MLQRNNNRSFNSKKSLAQIWGICCGKLLYGYTRLKLALLLPGRLARQCPRNFWSWVFATRGQILMNRVLVVVAVVLFLFFLSLLLFQFSLLSLLLFFFLLPPVLLLSLVLLLFILQNFLCYLVLYPPPRLPVLLLTPHSAYTHTQNHQRTNSPTHSVTLTTTLTHAITHPLTDTHSLTRTN